MTRNAASPDDPEEAQLRKALRPRSRMPTRAAKCRQWVMSRQDVEAFVRLMRELFPDIAFLRSDSASDGHLKWRIAPDPAAKRVDTYAVVPKPGWNAEEFCARPVQPLARWPRTYFSFKRSLGPVTRILNNGREIETLVSGRMEGWHARSDRETTRFLARVWRASGKITTNRTKIVDPETGRTVDPLWKYQWCGFDALRWCRERDNRFLEFSDRPTDDWAMPDSPYYD